MTSKQICFSTAVWDPKWFHDFKGQDHKFVKDGKIYGLRATCFMPRSTDCHGMPCQNDPKTCNFMQSYMKQLDMLEFDDVINALSNAANDVAKELDIDDPDVVILVHETPDNPCSERHILKKWFDKHWIKLKEWKKPE